MKARKKPLDTKSPADYGVATGSKLKTLKLKHQQNVKRAYK
jgi:electron transfer flavoprotein beta subunit